MVSCAFSGDWTPLDPGGKYFLITFKLKVLKKIIFHQYLKGNLTLLLVEREDELEKFLVFHQKKCNKWKTWAEKFMTLWRKAKLYINWSLAFTECCKSRPQHNCAKWDGELHSCFTPYIHRWLLYVFMDVVCSKLTTEVEEERRGQAQYISEAKWAALIVWWDFTPSVIKEFW